MKSLSNGVLDLRVLCGTSHAEAHVSLRGSAKRAPCGLTRRQGELQDKGGEELESEERGSQRLVGPLGGLHRLVVCVPEA